MSDSWADFETLRHGIKTNTVDRLKQILGGLNDETGTHFSKSGKKQEIIDRIVHTLDTWRAANTVDKWTKARAVLYQVRNSGSYTSSRMAQSLPGYSGNSLVKAPSFAPIAGSSTTTATPKYESFTLPPRKTVPNGIPSTSKAPTGQRTAIRFKESPFMQVDQMVSAIVECPESSSATDRRQQTVVFTLSNEHVSKLRDNGSKYQLRLFCTSSTFYSQGPTFRTVTAPCLIEFPPTCEVRVNAVQLTANLKGLKKKPGTAPPPDLGKYVRHTGQNRVEMVYVNSQQPVHSKKFYLVVMLVETTSVEHLVAALKQTNFKSRESIRLTMVESLAAEDDDIVSGPQKMSLKCPLSFMRIATPCRSSQCVHPHCFDATSWYSVMEQTTTWICPICEKVLDTKDLIIDGYFDSILKETPESVEDVMVEADGEWHSSDNKYGSTAWKAAHPPAPKVTIPSSPRKPAPIAGTLSNGGQSSRKPDEIFVLDSDDEEDRVKRELSPSFGSRSSVSQQSFGHSSTATSVPATQTDTVIDLTLDSDDEESPPPRYGKRKADDAELSSAASKSPVAKKGRAEFTESPVASSSHLRTSLAGIDVLQRAPPLRLPPPPANPFASSRFGSSYQGNNTLPPLHFSEPGSSRLGAGFPPISPPYSSSRVNGGSGSHWP